MDIETLRAVARTCRERENAWRNNQDPFHEEWAYGRAVEAGYIAETIEERIEALASAKEG